jgi:hypothetical protein
LFYLASNSSYADIGRLALLTVVVLLAACTIRSSWLINFEAPDTARDPMVYTQTSPDVPRMVKLIRDLASQSEPAINAPTAILPVVCRCRLLWMSVEQMGQVWLGQFQWYFRDMKRLEDRDDKFFTSATPDSFNVQNVDNQWTGTCTGGVSFERSRQRYSPNRT